MTSKPERSAGPGKATEGSEAEEKLKANALRIAKHLADEGEAQLEVQQRYDEMWNDPTRNQRAARKAAEE